MVLLGYNEIISRNEVKKFKPHLTLMKLSKMKKPKKGEKRLKKIPPELYENYKLAHFGTQNVQNIQLLSMTKPVREDGYYFTQHTFPLNIVQSQAKKKSKNTLLYVVSGATALIACAFILKKLRK